MKMVLSFLIINLLACLPQNSQDSQKLCIDFCALNKDRKFSVLYEIGIDTRFTKDKPNYIAIYCANVKGFYITIPLKVEELKTRKLYKSELFYKCKNGGKEDINFYKEYINSFEKEYNKIKVPDYHNYKNIPTQGNPRLGRFIAFTLNATSTVYYLGDSTTLTPYWKDKFSKLKKVDEKWYYECK